MSNEFEGKRCAFCLKKEVVAEILGRYVCATHAARDGQKTEAKSVKKENGLKCDDFS